MTFADFFFISEGQNIYKFYWTENKNSGFAGENVANRKQKIIDKLIEDKLIKILNTDG